MQLGLAFSDVHFEDSYLDNTRSEGIQLRMNKDDLEDSMD